jgi:hypothetical protein
LDFLTARYWYLTTNLFIFSWSAIKIELILTGRELCLQFCVTI